MNYVATFPKHRSINLNERQIVILLFTAQFITYILIFQARTNAEEIMNF